MANFSDKLALLITANSTQAVSELNKVGTSAKTNLGGAEKAGTSFTKSLAGMAVGGFAAVGGVTAVVGAVSHLVGAGREAERANRLTEAVIKSTGGAAHVSAAQVTELAHSISEKTGIDDTAVRSSENLLLTFTNVKNEVGKGNDIFNQATAAIQDMSVAIGQDARSSTIQLGKALNDPIKGLTSLRRVGVAFTEQQQDQIKTLVASGKSLEAQKIIIGELQKEFGGAAAAAADPIDKLKASFKNLEEEVGTQLVPVVNDYVGVLQDAVHIAGLLEGATNKTGLSFEGLNRSLLKTVPGVNLLVTAQEVRTHGQEKATAGDKAAAEAIKAVADATQKYTADLASGTASREQLAADAQAVADAQTHQTVIQNAVTEAVKTGTDAAGEAAAAEKKQADATKKLATELKHLNDDLLAAANTDLALKQSTLAVGDALDSYTQKVVASQGAKATDAAKTRELQEAHLGLSSAILSAVSAAEADAKAKVDATSKSTGAALAIEEENAKHRAAKKELDILKITYPQLTAEIDAYARSLRLIPRDIDTVVTVNGQRHAGGVSAGGGLRHFADGGFVPGPVGAPVPAIVHGGEFVVSNAMQRGSHGSGSRQVGGGIVVQVSINNPIGNGGEIAEQLTTALVQGRGKANLQRALGIAS